MKEFIISALPFILIGVSLAIIAANHKKEDKTYLEEGMALGMCFGVTFSTALKFDIGLGISLGMLVGEAIGILIKKNK